MGKQHQRMDRPGILQVPEGREQGKIKKTCCKIICGAPTTLNVKGLMIMIMMMMKTAQTLSQFEHGDLTPNERVHGKWWGRGGDF